MRGFLGNFGTSLSRLWGRREGLNLKSIRRARLVYALAYTFELLFYAHHKTWLHLQGSLLGINSATLAYIGHMLMSLVIMLLWSARFKPLIHISLAVTLLGFKSLDD